MKYSHPFYFTPPLSLKDFYEDMYLYIDNYRCVLYTYIDKYKYEVRT